MAKSTNMPAQQGKNSPEPWQSWGTTVRYVVIRLALAVPAIVLVWLAVACH
jgi:hypothetical protein